MNAQDIKNKLNINPESIVSMLDDLGFHHIRVFEDKRISCAFPDGDNINSLQILLSKDYDDAYLFTLSNTRNFNKGDIFDFIKWHKDMEYMYQAINHVASYIGESYTKEDSEMKSSASAKFLKSFIRRHKQQDVSNEKILPDSIITQFYSIPSKMFYDDGISIDSQNKFSVMYDYWDNRVVFPIRNDYGQIISIKGRTLEYDYKINNIPKYRYYENYNGSKYLFGLYENFHNIIEKNEIIIVEAEKGVMQCDSFGVNNVVAISKKKFTDAQIRKILGLGIENVVIMLDKDVLKKEIITQCKLFKRLINVYYCVDDNNYLDSNESPSDKGLDVFNKIYNERSKFDE